MLPDILNGLSGSSLAPPKAPFSGTHYAKEKIKGGTLHGDKRGMTGEGEDSDRVYLPPRGAPAGVHLYEDNGQVYGKHPSILARPHAYQVQGMYSIADIDSEPLWNQAKQEVMANTQGKMAPEQVEMVARNEAEWKLKEAGYDGYKSSSQPGNVLLFGNHPATDAGKPQDESGEANAAGQTNPEAQGATGAEPDADDMSSPSAPPDPQTFKTPHKFPMSPSDAHEDHAEGSDPANLIPATQS